MFLNRPIKRKKFVEWFFLKVFGVFILQFVAILTNFIETNFFFNYYKIRIILAQVG